mmetsp:Transcript_58041/g.136019  ORF Transcript_58041/g.136019 Transcript_58041/m.136019 type:complete len:974 (-) Transcript_58041:104-3025(-)
MLAARAALWASLLLWPGAYVSGQEQGECRSELQDVPNFLQMGLNLQGRQDRTRALKKSSVHSRPCPSMYPGCAGLLPVCLNPSPNAFRLGTAEPLADKTDPENLMLDLTHAIGHGQRVQILVMALFKQGAYTDDIGLIAERATPLEETTSTLLELQLSSDGQTVEVYKPVMDLRTSDPESRYALSEGVGAGLLASLPRFQCTGDGPERVIVDVAAFLDSGFWVVDTSSLGPDVTVIKAKDFPHNLDITADYGPYLPLLRVGYTLLLLPTTPMQPRANDDRLLYFDTQYQDKGSHPREGNQKPSQTVDSQISMIWRYDLHRRQTIRFYVDPSIPKRWRPFFKKGIEEWNSAFTLVERPKAMRAVLPEDEDWPSDYDMSDARFSAITWDVDEATVSMGIAKVDPRSGEIMKCDIVMGDSWVKNYLGELEMNSVNFTNFLNKPGKLSSVLAQKMATTGKASANASRISSLLQQGRSERQSRSFGFATAYMHKRVLYKDLEALIGSALKEIVMHEVGHCLGLRHNFKGSMGVSMECLKDPQCTAKEGTSASVMDYIAVNLPRPGDPLTHLWSPTVGGYDKLAIRYGYTHLTTPASDPGLHEILEDVLKEAENFQTCYDDDNRGEDPSCLDYDLSSDPVGYWEQQLSLYADVQRHLLDMSVVEGDSYHLYGHAVQSVLGGFLPEIGVNAIWYLGGVNYTYLHKYSSQERLSRQPVPVEIQRRALDVALKLLRPKNEGLLPPEHNLPYLVDGVHLAGVISSFDLTDIVAQLRRVLLEEMLRAERLLQIHKQENILRPSAAVTFTVSELLSSLVYSAMSAGLDQVASEDERDLQRLFVQILSSSLPVDADFLPAEVVAQIEYFRSFVLEMVEGALGKLKLTPDGPQWSMCAGYNQTCTCTGLLRLRLSPNQSSAEQWSGSTRTCLPESFFINVSENEASAAWCECLSLTQTDTDAREAQRLHIQSLKQMLLKSSGPPMTA